MKRVLFLAFLTAAAFAVGYLFAPNPALPAPMPNNEQLVRATSTLTDWLERNDTDALGYDFPNLLGCDQRGGWLICRYGVTYIDECTRRYTIGIDRNNLPRRVWRAKLKCGAPPPP